MSPRDRSRFCMTTSQRDFVPCPPLALALFLPVAVASSGQARTQGRVMTCYFAAGSGTA